MLRSLVGGYCHQGRSGGQFPMPPHSCSLQPNELLCATGPRLQAQQHSSRIAGICRRLQKIASRSFLQLPAAVCSFLQLSAVSCSSPRCCANVVARIAGA
eukprot:11770535-Alexandrium_andersonii.AAC.1